MEEPEFYLYKNFAGENSYLGLIFAGHGEMDNQSIPLFLHGHNMKNGTMFSTLLKYSEYNYWKDNSIILLDSLRKHYKYKIFSVFYTTEEEWIRSDGIFYSILQQNGCIKTKEFSKDEKRVI